MRRDSVWRKRIEDEINGLKERVKKMEDVSGGPDPTRKIIELDIEWPEADIGGIHFTAQKTRGVFELKEDGNYYSRDILFMSARDTDGGTCRDLLSGYLGSEAVKKAFLKAAGNSIAQDCAIRVFLPESGQGVKKYNGVGWWYWLRPCSSGSAANFCIVSGTGYALGDSASAVGGCAPAFCVA